MVPKHEMSVQFWFINPTTKENEPNKGEITLKNIMTHLKKKTILKTNKINFIIGSCKFNYFSYFLKLLFNIEIVFVTKNSQKKKEIFNILTLKTIYFLAGVMLFLQERLVMPSRPNGISCNL